MTSSTTNLHARWLLVTIIVLAIVPPGYSAYIGAYAAQAFGLLALLAYTRGGKEVWSSRLSLTLLAAIALVALTVPFTYRAPVDLIAPVLMLPMLLATAMGLLAKRTNWVPSPTHFAMICLAAAIIAFTGGAVERFVLGLNRPGLGNNPIHYSSLAVMAGSLALLGIPSGKSLWRFAFLAGPVLGIGAAIISDSRGPLVGAVAVALAAAIPLAVWFRRERAFQIASVVAALVCALIVAGLLASGNQRAISIIESGMNIFRFTGGYDDIRAALYRSAIIAVQQSPLVGLGFGQIMEPARTLFPEQSQVFTLENLHADWANFAAMAGSMGLLSYVLLLLSPFAIERRRGPAADRTLVLGAIVLSVGQLTLGVSNAMFGVLPQTTVFAAGLGYLYARSLVSENKGDR